MRICDAKFGNIYRAEGDGLRIVATHNMPPVFAETRRSTPSFSPGPKNPVRRMMTTKAVVQVMDVGATEAYAEREPVVVDSVELGNTRTLVIVPMLKDNELIGAFTLARQEVRPFTDKQIAVLTNFAAQAVIAIENARLLNELRQRTDDLTGRTADLTEALEQQTATSEVLQVISSTPGDPQPVFATMLENAVRICDATFGNIFRWDGEAFQLMAAHKTPPAFAKARKLSPIRPAPTTLFGRLVATKSLVHTPDLAAEKQYVEERRPAYVEAVQLGGIRTFLAVPMLKDDELIGAFGLFRQEVRPFTDKQIELVKNFAAQAVIAIENARLLAELRKRTDDLETSLEYQTATSDVLKVISGSVFDLQKILRFVAETAARLCAAKQVGIFLLENHVYRFTIGFGLTSAYREIEERLALEPGPETLVGRVALKGETVHIPDALSDPHYGPKDDI